MRDLAVTTRHGIPVRIVLRRPIAEILADWKADAIRRRHAVPAKRKTKSAPVGGAPVNG